MKFTFSLLVIFFVITFISLSQGFSAGGNGTGPSFCGQDTVSQLRMQRYREKHGLKETPQATCAQESVCDSPSFRNKYTQANPLTIRLQFHVIRSVDGKDPAGTGRTAIAAQINLLQSAYGVYNIQFDVDIDTDVFFHNGYTYQGKQKSGLSKFSNTNPTWLLEAEAMKDQYATLVGKALNIFVSTQESSSSGTLLGFGTFPWDPEALSSNGGVWMNGVAMGAESTTLIHEIGHTVGLWHAFHGIQEVSCGSGCYEYVHSLTDSSDDLVGDFCADTYAVPLQYTDSSCSPPPGTDCAGTSFTDSKYVTSSTKIQLDNNYMMYVDDSCMTMFSNCQVARIRCYVCNLLPAWGVGC